LKTPAPRTSRDYEPADFQLKLDAEIDQTNQTEKIIPVHVLGYHESLLLIFTGLIIIL